MTEARFDLHERFNIVLTNVLFHRTCTLTGIVRQHVSNNHTMNDLPRRSDGPAHLEAACHRISLATRDGHSQQSHDHLRSSLHATGREIASERPLCGVRRHEMRGNREVARVYENRSVGCRTMSRGFDLTSPLDLDQHTPCSLPNDRISNRRTRPRSLTSRMVVYTIQYMGTTTWASSSPMTPMGASYTSTRPQARG